MNGKTAKKLRRIARSLGLPPETAYAPGGKLRRAEPDRIERDAAGVQHVIPGRVMRRPGVLVECERRAYKEAKKLYLGKSAPGIEPDTGEKKDESFHVRMLESIKRQQPGPV